MAVSWADSAGMTLNINHVLGCNRPRWHKPNYNKYDVLCHMVFCVTIVNISMTLFMYKWTNSVMDDEWVRPLVWNHLDVLSLPLTFAASQTSFHWPKPYLLLSSTCDEILSWMIQIWMKIHLVSDSNCNTVYLKKLQEMTNHVGVTLSVGDTIPQFTVSIELDY